MTADKGGNLNESEIVGYKVITDGVLDRTTVAEMEQDIADEVSLGATPEDRRTVRSMVHTRRENVAVIVTPWKAIREGSASKLQRRGERVLSDFDDVKKTDSFHTTGNPVKVLHERT